MAEHVGLRSEVRELADAVRRERGRVGVTLAELSARAGVAKSTISDIETGRANPSIETLWRLADALGVSVARLLEPMAPEVDVVRAGEGVVVVAEDSEYVATVLFAGSARSALDLYRIEVGPGDPHVSRAHPDGTVEHVFVASGSARVGPVAAEVRLEAGDYVRYRADRPHSFVALQPTVAVMAIESR